MQLARSGLRPRRVTKRGCEARGTFSPRSCRTDRGMQNSTGGRPLNDMRSLGECFDLQATHRGRARREGRSHGKQRAPRPLLFSPTRSPGGPREATTRSYVGKLRGKAERRSRGRTRHRFKSPRRRERTVPGDGELRRLLITQPLREGVATPREAGAETESAGSNPLNRA